MVYTICFNGDVEILEKLEWPLPRAPLIAKCCGLVSGIHMWLKCQPWHITWPTLTYNLANPDIELGDHCVKNVLILYIIIRLRFQGLAYLTRRVSLIEQELLTLPEHLSSSTVFLFCVSVYCTSLSVLLWITTSGYPFGIFKLF